MYHTNTDIPKKSSKLHPLTKIDKKQNRQRAKERVGIEHTNRKLKSFVFSRRPIEIIRDLT